MNSKRMLLVTIIISMLLSFVTGGETFYNTWVFSLIILGLNYLIVKNNIKKIDSNFVINKESHIVSEKVKFKYILVNKSIIPIFKASVNLILSKEFGFISTEVEELSFRSNQIVELHRSFICEKRGYFEIGKIEAEVSDVFGIFIKRKILDKSINVKVYPRIVEVKKLSASLSGFLGNVSSSNSSPDDFTNIKSIREYNIGDNPKNIHFKLSAKSDKTFIKEYLDSNYLDLIVLLDAFYNDDKSSKSEELCVSTSLSIVKYILEKKGEVQYILSNKSNINSKLNSLSAFSNLVENIVTSKFDGEKSLENYLGNILHNIQKTSDYIIITRHIDKATADKLISMKARGNSISLYIIDFESDRNNKYIESIKSSLEQNGISTYFIKDLGQL